jgi:hypothetical protein
VPGSGAQVHDFNGGILSSGLFWTVPADEHNLWVSRSRRTAVLEVRDVPVIDSFQFFGPDQVAASVSFRIEWSATGRAMMRGKGATVPETDMAAFEGEIAPARSAIVASAQEWGFTCHAKGGTAGGYAQMGDSRNGDCL